MATSLRYYSSTFIMRNRDSSTLRIIDLWSFRSLKSKRRYIVEIESFKHHFYGVKFYCKSVSTSRDRYSILTNDNEPRSIVMSCIQVMLNYYNEDKFASFGFVAANDINSDGHINKRFRFYRRMMLSLFSSDKFIHLYDSVNYIYLLVNKSMIEHDGISVKDIEKELGQLYIGDYSLNTD